MDKEDMEAYLDFSLMAAERKQKQHMNLNQIDKNADDNTVKQNWSEISELSGNIATTQGLDLTSEYLVSKSATNVQYTPENFLMASDQGQGNEETKGSNSDVTKMEIGSLFQQVNQEKPLKDGDNLSKAVDNSQVFSRQEETMDDRNVSYSPWSYNDEIVVLNLSRGEKNHVDPATVSSNSTDNIVDQFESNLQSGTEMHLNFFQREQNNLNSSFLCDQKNQDVESDTKPQISQTMKLGDLEQGKEDDQTCESVDNVEGPSCSDMLEREKGDDSDQHCEIIQNKAASEIEFHADDVAVERSMYISKERTVVMDVGPQFDLCGSQLVTSENDYPVKAPIKVRSPIKMSFKKRKYKIQNMCKGEDSADTLVLNDIQDSKKFCQEKLIETSTGNDSDCDVDNDGLVEENVPLDYSMHATLVRQNLSKSSTTDQATTKHLSDTDATTSDQDQESFCSSLKLVSVSDMEQKKSSGSRLKSESGSSTEDEIEESDSKEEETDQKAIGQVDKFVLERLIKNCQKKSKVKTTANSNSKVKVFNCDTCSKTFTRKSTWRHHVKIHVEDKFKECKVCGKKLKFSGNMLSHLKTHTGDRPFKCQFCEKTFTRAASLYTHVRSHTGEKAFLCEICGKGFADKSHYRRHLRIHSGIKPFKCDVCEMAFTQSWSLKSHMLCHAEEKPHICSFCGKGYTQKAYLESHIRSHTGERPYSCETCGKSFSDSSCMRRHAKSHLGERSFICELCGKAFGRGWNLTVHMRIHYDDKRYECYICGKAFVQKINLDKHILTHPAEPCD